MPSINTYEYIFAIRYYHYYTKWSCIGSEMACGFKMVTSNPGELQPEVTDRYKSGKLSKCPSYVKLDIINMSKSIEIRI